MTFGVDHIISGVVITRVAPGLTLFLAKLYFADAPGGGQKQSPPIPDVGEVSVPGLSSVLGDLEDEHWVFVSDIAGVLRGLVTDVSLLSLLTVRCSCSPHTCCGAHRSGSACGPAVKRRTPPNRSA